MKTKNILLAGGAAALTYLALTKKKEESANSLVVDDDNSVHVTQTSPSEPGREEELVEQPNLLTVRTPLTTQPGVYGEMIAEPITLVAGQTYTFTFMGKLSQTSVDEGLRLWASPEYNGINKEGVEVWYYPADIVPLDERCIDFTTPTIVSFTFKAEYTGVYNIYCWENIIHASQWEEHNSYPYKGGDVIEWVKLEKGTQFTGYTPEDKKKKNDIVQPFDGGLKDAYKTNPLYRGDINKKYDPFYDYTESLFNVDRETNDDKYLNAAVYSGSVGTFMRARIIPQWVGVSEEEMWTDIAARYFVDKLFESWWGNFHFNMVGKGLGMFAGIELFNPTDYPISLDYFYYKDYSLNDRPLIFLDRNNQTWSDTDNNSDFTADHPRWAHSWNINYDWMLNRIFKKQRIDVLYQNSGNFYYNIPPRSSVIFFQFLPGWFVERAQFDYNQYTVVNSLNINPKKGSKTYTLNYDVNPFKDSSSLRFGFVLKGHGDNEESFINCGLQEGAATKVYDKDSWKTQHINSELAELLDARPTALQELLNQRLAYWPNEWQGHEAEQALFEAVKNTPPEEFLKMKFI